MYVGPIIDSFLHSPWIGGAGSVTRADVVPWTDDPRLRRVMSTFHHAGEPGEDIARLGLPDVLTAMDSAAVESGVLAAKVYYPTTVERLDSLHRELSSLSAASAGRLRWTATVMPPEHGPGSYWDLMQNPRIVQALSKAPGLIGVHITPSPWGPAPNDRSIDGSPHPFNTRWISIRRPIAAAYRETMSKVGMCRAFSNRAITDCEVPIRFAISA